MALSLVASVSLQADPVSGSSTFTTFPFEPPSTLRPGTKLLLCFRHHPSRDLGYFNPWNLSPSAKKGSSQGPRGSLERSPCAVPWFECRRSCLLSLTGSPLTMNLNSRGLSVWLEYVFRCFMQTTVFKIITLFTAKKFNISRCITYHDSIGYNIHNKENAKLCEARVCRTPRSIGVHMCATQRQQSIRETVKK
jgi:hypothetical protein